jgi:hypothetical protein
MAQSDLQFIKQFAEHVKEYLEMFADIEALYEEEREPRWGQKRKEYTEKEIQDLASRFQLRRHAIVEAYDRAVSIAEKYDVHQEFYSLLKCEPGKNEYRHIKNIDDDYYKESKDSFTRLISVIEHQPKWHQRFGRWLASLGPGMFATDKDRAILKYLIFALIVAAILKLLGLDVSGVVAIVNAIK